LERIQEAVDCAEASFEKTARYARPGRRETEIARFMREQAAEAEAVPAWDPRQCPIVCTGPESMPGHAFPSSKLKVERGRILHIDFGVRKGGYCSDLQRAWYVGEPGEERPPKPVLKAFETIVRAIHAAAKSLKPGVMGWEVDQVARQIVIEDGYAEYQHATGHQVGRSAHDGGCVLGPQWRRYGRTPHYKVERGNVFTLELGIDDVDGRGYLGLEEMVVVTKKGCEFLSNPQTALDVL
jgi:Xaa-Pro aminopeptidase